MGDRVQFQPADCEQLALHVRIGGRADWADPWQRRQLDPIRSFDAFLEPRWADDAKVDGREVMQSQANFFATPQQYRDVDFSGVQALASIERRTCEERDGDERMPRLERSYNVAKSCCGFASRTDRDRTFDFAAKLSRK